MPARPYTLPPGQDKESPEDINLDTLFINARNQGGLRISKYLLNSIRGFSPILCEVCYRGKLMAKHIDDLTDAQLKEIKIL